MAALSRRIFKSPSLVFCLALVAILFLVAWQFNFHSNQTTRGLASLNKAYERQRPFEARISDFAYAPLAAEHGTNPAQNNQAELKHAENILIESVSENETADNLHSLGRFYLAQKDFPAAINQFQKALKLLPDDAKTHNDLGTAWLEKGKNETAENKNSANLEFLAKGFEEFEQAIQVDKSFAETYFNRALCLQALNLPTATKNAWREYLKIDPSSDWTREAKINLEVLETQKNISPTTDELIQKFLEISQKKDDEKAWHLLSRNREMVSGKLIPQQLAARYSKTRKKEFLEALRYAGEVEFSNTRDSFWKDVGAFYAAANDEKISSLEQAQDFLTKGYELCLKGKYADALPVFKQARDIFARNADEREAKLAAYWIGYCQYVLNKLTESKRELESLAQYCRANDYRWLLAHALFWTGTSYGSENQSSKAIDYYKKALEAAESVSDFYNAQKILTETAEEYRLVGRADLSLDYLQKSLALSDYPESSLRQKSRTYNTLVRTFYTLKSYNVALAYEKEAVLLLAEIEDAVFHQISNVQLGEILAAQKNYDEALKVLEESLRDAEALENQGQRNERIAFSNLQIAHLKRETGACGEALASYNAAVAFYDTGEYKAERYDAHKGRLFCYQTENDAQNFEVELKTVLEIFEKNRAAILDEQTRNIFFDNEQTVYDAAIAYEYGRGNSEKAFDYSEPSRSRSLLDLLEKGGEVEKNGSKLEVKIKEVSAPLSLREIRAAMPEQVEIAEYAVLKDKVLIWLISKTDFQVVEAEISDEDLRAKTNSYLKLVSTNDESRADERRQLSIELYQLLISPFINKIGDEKKICLIADKSLLHLPFAALAAPESGQYFIGKRKFFFAPSANLFLAFTKNARRLSENQTENILSIGNPAFDRKTHASLQNLPAAEREASEIARYYLNPVVLLRQDATKAKVLKNLARANVIHFAGHYIASEHAPLSSSFILANDAPDAGGDLANYELIGKNFSHTRLVVLSACQTGAENYYNGEGMIGASRTFLAAGIPLVVASLWSVDSDATAELMIRFHHYRKIEKFSTVDALRAAQLDLINTPEGRFKNPYYWSAFITLGGYSEF
ncbi:MAG: CHAT domain-containing protein [Acidobacteriota bacterium]|nr:CHAT domain-containing protein [Acidobacteriota bacterium]